MSAHWFSPDGKDWQWSPQPYGHTVNYDDGTSHTYTTMERPNLHFDATGQLTHLNVAADLVTGDEGCGNRTRHAHFGHTPCDNCKWCAARRRHHFAAPRGSARGHVPPKLPRRGGRAR